MPTLPELETVTDAELLAGVRKLVARTNEGLAHLLAHLGEVEARGIYRERACASLYTYCVYELRMSEDEAYRRAKGARLVRQFPELFERIANGELHLTGLLLLGPHLDCERRREILDCARFRSKREIQELVARLDPKPDVPARVEAIGSAPAGRATHLRLVRALAPAVRSLPVGSRPADWIEADENDDDKPGAEPDVTLAAERGSETDGTEQLEPPTMSELLSPVRFHVQFTATQEHVDAMNEALDLLSHELSSRDIAEVYARAMTLLVAALRKKKRAASDSPPATPVCAGDSKESGTKSKPETTRGRYIPAEIRPQVWVRDEARCRYVDDAGQRCAERARLELHHRHAYAKGGSHSVANIELRCRAHNDLAAEQDFGREHMANKKGSLRGGDPRRRDSFDGAGRITPGLASALSKGTTETTGFSSPGPGS